MKFDPKTEQEIIDESILPDGEYKYEVVYAEERESQGGNDMFEVRLSIKRDDGKEFVVYDYLLPAFPRKLLQFCKSTGLLSKYKAGELTERDLLEGKGTCVLHTPKNDNPNFEDRNAVKKYLVPLSEKIAAAKADAPSFDDEDVGF